MLQFIKCLSSSRTQVSSKSSSLSTMVLRTFGKAKPPKDPQAKVEARQRIMYNKREANKSIVEELYFPDHSQMRIQEYIEEKKQERLENDLSGKVQLNEEDMKYIEEISSQGINEEAQQKSFYFPETKEEMSKLIAHTDINDRLLKVYMKYHKLCSKYQIFEILGKLEENLRIEEEVREREIEKYKKKVKRLQKIAKDVEVKFPATFLTQEETLNHPGFQFLVQNINFKSCNKIYQPYSALELYHSLMKFDPKCFKMFETDFFLVRIFANFS